MTTTNFDTFYKNQWSGELNVAVRDNDGTPNRVLDITKPWQILLQWSLSTTDPNDAPVNLITQGHWRVEAFAESVGTAVGGLEGPLLPFENHLFADMLPGATTKSCAWERVLTIPAGKINEPGIYKVTVMLQYHTEPNVYTIMVGFAEHPNICFNRLP